MKIELDLSENEIILLSSLLMDDYNQMGYMITPDIGNPDMTNFDNRCYLYAREFILNVVYKLLLAKKAHQHGK